MSHVDLHLHLLPRLDDGAPTEADAVRYAARMANDGVLEATVTPHVGHPSFRVEVGSLEERVATLQDALRAHGIPVRLRTGGELHPSRADELAPEDLELIAQGPAGGRWVLLEVPFAGIDERFVATARSITERGFGLVIAHPERAKGLLRAGLRLLRPLLEEGAVLQVSVDSLGGQQGEEAQVAARHLLRSRLAYLLASDAHPGRREQTLAEGLALARRAGLSAVASWQLTQANPRFLLEHGLPAAPVPAPTVRPPWRTLWGREVEAVRRVRTAGRRSGAGAAAAR